MTKTLSPFSDFVTDFVTPPASLVKVIVAKCDLLRFVQMAKPEFDDGSRAKNTRGGDILCVILRLKPQTRPEHLVLQ